MKEKSSYSDIVSLIQLARKFEEQAELCSRVRLYGLSSACEQTTLLTRSLALESCAKQLRTVVSALTINKRI